jgi:hypothetical protein
MRKTILAILLIAPLLVGCGLKARFDAAPSDETLVKWTEAGITAVKFLKGASNLAFSLGCPVGQIPPEICDMQKIASKAADSALAAAQSALAAYKADPSTGNAGVLNAARVALMEAWTAFNQINSTEPFLVSDGRPIHRVYSLDMCNLRPAP